LPSAASKKLRRSNISDMLRSRVWISDDLLKNDSVYKTIYTIFQIHISKLRDYYASKGYRMVIYDINIKNKFSNKTEDIYINDDKL
jgi:hypothetical protein